MSDADLKSFNQLHQEIGEWSLKNFGEQPSSNPMLGVNEEYFEFRTSITIEDSVDAVCDITIYLLDVLYREGISVPEIVEYHSSLDHAMHNLNHAYLKRKQGIRGFDSTEKFLFEFKGAVSSILFHLNRLLVNGMSAGSLLHNVNQVWNKVVSQRDWTK